MGNFNDIDFDGVLLKIPAVRTENNKDQLDAAFSKIKNIIEDEIKPVCCFSHVHPAWYKNENELDEWYEKKDVRKEEEDRNKRIELGQKIKREQIRKRNLFEIEWQEETNRGYNEWDFPIGNEDYTYEDLFGKSKMYKKVAEKIWEKHTADEILDAIRNNHSHMIWLKYDVHPDDYVIPTEFLIPPDWYTIGVRLKRRGVWVYHRDKTNDADTFFHIFCPLFWDSEKGCRFIDITHMFPANSDIFEDERIEWIKPEDSSTEKRAIMYLDSFERHQNYYANQEAMEALNNIN